MPKIINNPIASASSSRKKRSTRISKNVKELYKKAWAEVKEKSMSIYKASKQYGLNKSTLRNWCAKDNLDIIPQVGRPCFFGSILEQKLEKWILESAASGRFLHDSDLFLKSSFIYTVTKLK